MSCPSACQVVDVTNIDEVKNVNAIAIIISNSPESALYVTTNIKHKIDISEDGLKPIAIRFAFFFIGHLL